MSKDTPKITVNKVFELLQELCEEFTDREIRDFLCEQLDLDFCPSCDKFCEREDITEAGDCAKCAKEFAAEQSYYDWFFNRGK